MRSSNRHPSKQLIFLKILVLSFVARFARGAPERNFGMGGMSTGRVGALTAEPQNPFAADNNPALMAVAGTPHFALTFGGGSAQLQPNGAVLTDSPEFRTTTGRREVRGVPALEPMGFSRWSLGLVFPFSLSRYVDRRAGLGVAFSGPFGKVRQLQSESPYSFQSLHYGAPNDQLKASVGLGAELIPDTLFFGAGLSFYISAAGALDAVLLSDNPTGRMDMEIRLNSAAILGMYAKWADFGLSVVYRQAADPKFAQSFTGRAEIAEGARTLDLPFVMQTSLFYEPHRFEMDFQHAFGALSVSVGTVFELWSSFEPSFFKLTAKTRGGGEVSTSVPELPFQNTLSPRASAKVSLGKGVDAGVGYQWRASPITDAALSGSANVLDAGTHVLGAALQVALGDGAWLPFPLRLGIFGQIHLLNKREVKKTAARYIGAPSYSLEGSAYFLGLQLEGSL